MYSTSELAAPSGVTARTLRYYDHIGLLTPPLAANGYRQYGQAEVDRLQMILTYRALAAALAVQKGGVAMTDPAKFEALKAQRLKENGAAYGQEIEALR